MADRKSTISIGDRFVRLVVIGFPEHRIGGHKMLICRCDCGKEKLIRAIHAQSGACKSCGCFSRENARKRVLTHGHAPKGKQSPEYRSWSGMIRRCTRDSSTQWKHYGARGIKVDPRWQSFENFLKDMGNRPKGTSLDRIDNNADYGPTNCRWASKVTQARNKRTARIIEAFGETHCAAEWAELTGIAAGTIIARLRAGWPAEKAVSITPPQRTGHSAPRGLWPALAPDLAAPHQGDEHI